MPVNLWAAFIASLSLSGSFRPHNRTSLTPFRHNISDSWRGSTALIPGVNVMVSPWVAKFVISIQLWISCFFIKGGWCKRFSGVWRQFRLITKDPNHRVTLKEVTVSLEWIISVLPFCEWDLDHAALSTWGVDGSLTHLLASS